MNSKQQAPTKRGEITTTTLIIRVLIGGLTAAVVLTALNLLTTRSIATTLSAQNIIVRIISGVLYVGIMAPLARQTFSRALSRFLAIFLALYITGALTDLVEAYYYTTLLTPVSLIAALIFQAIPLLIISGIICWLIPTTEKVQKAPRFTHQVIRNRRLLSWIWRIVVAGVPYAVIYLFFAALVTPLEHAYYYDKAFIDSLHTRVPSTITTLILESVRGILFVLAQLPVIVVMRKSRWGTGLYIALIGAALEAWIPLLGQTSWPVMMRLGNLLELTGDACGRALLMALLLVMPYPQIRSRLSEYK
ncbi:hypothetical protein [Paenibacillus aestuarii]|uniref:DUF4386 domain-containing protein n=1 Tax=Paenibacillus aestuarii TaxID=516965 RepID=A0ABW0KDS3_9BACL|nr:hypothetical protein [Paenibacillus aestuarii]